MCRCKAPVSLGFQVSWKMGCKCGIAQDQNPYPAIGASHDTMDPEYMKWMSTQFPKGQFVLCPNGGHASMWDDQEHYFPGLIAFLKQ